MSWNDFKPELLEEKENDNVFGPVNGKYVAPVIDFGRKVGVSEKTGNSYDFISVKFQILDTVSGDNANKRYFDKTFFLSDDDYGTKDDKLKNFCNMVYTITKNEMNLNIRDEDDFEARVLKVITACDGLIGSCANLTIYPQKDKVTKKVKVDDKGNAKHTVLVVAEHKSKDKKSIGNMPKEEVPF